METRALETLAEEIVRRITIPMEASGRHIHLSRAAVVVGSEGRGVSPLALELSEKTVKIPMRARCESLNAGVAASVVLWEMARGGLI